MKEPNQQKRLYVILGSVQDGILGDGLRYGNCRDVDVDLCFSTWYFRETALYARLQFCDPRSVVPKTVISNSSRTKNKNKLIA